MQNIFMAAAFVVAFLVMWDTIKDRRKTEKLREKTEKLREEERETRHQEWLEFLERLDKRHYEAMAKADELNERLIAHISKRDIDN